MPTTKPKRSQRKLTTPQVVAIIIAVITGLCTVIAAFVGLGVPLINSLVNLNNPSSIPQFQATPLPTPAYYRIPAVRVAGEQLDFAPILVGVSTDEIPSKLQLNETPHEGVYISQLSSFRAGDISWWAYYQNGESEWAESETCLIVKDYPEEYQAPMNLRANKTMLSVDIYTARQYALKIKGGKITIVNYTSPRTDIDYLQPFRPGGGGPGPGWIAAPYALFLPVQTDDLTVTSEIGKSYDITFSWFDLQPGNGVNIKFPVSMIDAGTYQFQVDVEVIATNTQNNHPENIILTTGRDSYGWLKIKDPRNHKVLLSPYDPPANLEPCP